MLEENHEKLSIRRQCDLLGISSSVLYYKPVEVSEETLKLMNAIDETSVQSYNLDFMRASQVFISLKYPIFILFLLNHKKIFMVMIN